MERMAPPTILLMVAALGAAFLGSVPAFIALLVLACVSEIYTMRANL